MPPDRFPASIKWSHADELEQLCNRIAASVKYSITPPDALFLGQLAGALNYARANLHQPPEPGPLPAEVSYDFGPIAPGSLRTDWVPLQPGAIFALTVPGPGRVSANVDDGSSMIAVSAYPDFRGPFGVNTVQAAGNSTWLHVTGGRVYGKFEGGQARKVRWDWSPDA